MSVLSDYRMLQVAMEQSKRSPAIRRKVGAVLVDSQGLVVSSGFNAMPKDSEDQSCEHVLDGQLVSKEDVVHAEVAAISKIILFPSEMERLHTMYVTACPCLACATYIASKAFIKRVVCCSAYRLTEGLEYLLSKGIMVDYFEISSGALYHILPDNTMVIHNQSRGIPVPMKRPWSDMVDVIPTN